MAEIQSEKGAVLATTLAGAALGAVATFPFPAIGGIAGALVGTGVGALIGAGVGAGLKEIGARRSHPSLEGRHSASTTRDRDH